MRLVKFLLAALLACASAAGPAVAQKQGGILRMYSPDSPASMSIHEEATVYAQGPMMGVFNNLIMFDPHIRQSSLDSIRPDLATSWKWNEDKSVLNFTLREGVRWHDGKPFTAKDVVCTFDLLMGRATEKLRVNPRGSNFKALDRVTADSDLSVTFHLKRPQPAFPILLATGFGSIYPCHVPAAQMRRAPIGTGPFKFVEFKPNEIIKVARNPDYWKPGLPYLDGIEYQIIRNASTATLAFVSGKVDMTFTHDLLPPIYRDVRGQAPDSICEMTPAGGVYRTLMVNRTTPPFDNADLRRAMSLSLDRKAFVDIITEGEGQAGGVLQPPPGGRWGLPPDKLAELPGYSADVAKSRAEARAMMEKLGYGPNKRLPIKMMTRDLANYRNPAIRAIDQLREIYIDAELEAVDTSLFFPRLIRKDFTVALSLMTSGPDPDPVLDLFYSCTGSLNNDGYCNAEVDKLIEQQSMEDNPDKRRQMVWDIERKLVEDGARPVIFYTNAGTCWKPYVKGVTMMVNSLYNANRREDVWLDK